MKLINDNGGFTVIGWYKRGEINDISTDESQNEVESSEVGHHIVSVYPSRPNVVNSQALKNENFDFASFSKNST